VAGDQGENLGEIAPDAEVGPRVREEVPTTFRQGTDLETIDLEALPTGVTPAEVRPRVLEERSATFRLGFQELVRAGLAFTFAGLLLLIVVLAFRSVYDDAEWKNTKELLQVLLPAVTALLGSALGFYFGSRPR